MPFVEAQHVIPEKPNDMSESRAPGHKSPALGIQNLRMMRLLQRIATKFNDAAIPLMVLKGAALNLTLYDRCDERSMSDIDLLIHPKDVDKACALFEELGGLRGEPLVREDFFPRYYYAVEYKVGSIHPVRFDLHIRPFRPLRYSQIVPVDALWERASTVSIGRANILVPSVEEMSVHLAVHATVHGFSDGKWLTDIKRWVEAHGADIDWDRLLATAQQWRLALPVRKAFQRVQRDLGLACPSWVTHRLSRMRVTWRDRLALWHAPRDANHSATHVTVNLLCTPGCLFILGYLKAVLIPDRIHMSDWYGRRHAMWLPCAHILRWLAPMTRHIPSPWRWHTNVETRKSKIHGIGVIANRKINGGVLIAQFQGKEVDHDGMYVVPIKNETGQTKKYEITGKLKFLNHSCRPNAELRNFELVALKPIAAGTEITIDYGEDACDCRHDSPETNNGAKSENIRRKSNLPQPRIPALLPGRVQGVSRATRRSFLRGVGKKALYVAPVVMTLAAQQAYAASGEFDSTCGDFQSPCTVDADCCENNCIGEPMMMICTNA